MKKYFILIIALILYISCSTPVETDTGLENSTKNKFIIIGAVWNKGNILANTPVIFEYSKPGSNTIFRKTAYTNTAGVYYLDISYGNYAGEYMYKIYNGPIEYLGATKRGTTVTYNFIHK